MNLYTLTAAQHVLIAQLEAADFDSQTIADTLEGEDNTEALREKRLGYVAIIKQKRIMADARQAAANAITALMQKDCEDAERLEAALFDSMQATGDKDLIGIEFEAHIKGKPAAVVIADSTLVPGDYWVTPEPKTPVSAISKNLIRDALKAGRVVPGASLGIDKKLVIK
jgi:Siphovirus Gp157